MRCGHHTQMQQATTGPGGFMKRSHRFLGILHLVEDAPRLAQHLFTHLT